MPKHDPLWVVGVPGIREYRLGAPTDRVREMRAAQWRQALAAAMSRGALDHRVPRQVHVHIVLYADRLLRRPVPIAQGVVDEIVEDDSHGPKGLLESATVELLRDLAGLTDKSSPLEAVCAWAKWVGLSPGAALRYAQTHLVDITTYLSCREHLTPGSPCDRCARRSEIRESVAAAIRDPSGNGAPAEVVIGRDLGAVIAYEALCLESVSDVKVPLLLTVGAPLALASVRDRLDPAPKGGGAGIWPRPVARWIDVRTRTDALRGGGAEGTALSEWFSDVTDRVVDDGKHDLFHDDAYLDCDAVGEILRRRGRKRQP
jgi:hypothetical protein